MKKVIYTSIVGKYDHLTQPSCVDLNFDFICFSNDINETKVGVWQIRKIPHKTKDPQRLSRYAKMHPQELLPDYEISIWMDANITVIGPTIYNAVKEMEEKPEVLLAGIKHPFRRCVYREAPAVVRKRKDLNLIRIYREMSFLRKEGFPLDFGMYEANIIYRRHQHPSVKKQCALWWEMLHRYSRRDQLAYSYTLWKCGLPLVYLLPENFSSRNHPDFKYIAHINSPDDTFKEKLWQRYVVKTAGRVLYRIYCKLLNIKR